MAMRLIEWAKTEQDELRRGVIEEFAKSSVVLDYLPFQDIEGNAYTYNKEHRLPGIGFRGVNESYDEGTGIVNPATETLKIMGGDADTDKFLIKTQRAGLDRRATDIGMKVKAAGLYFTKIFFDGDQASDPVQFDGLNDRLTGNQVIAAGTDGANISHNLLLQAIHAIQGTPDLIVMGKQCLRNMNNLSEASIILTIGKDDWGRQIKLYDGIPIGIVEEDNDDNTILAFDETQGSTTGACASLYVLKFGADEFLSGLQNGALDAYDLGEIDDKPVFRARIEWYITIAIFHSKSASRLKGITAAVS